VDYYFSLFCEENDESCDFGVDFIGLGYFLLNVFMKGIIKKNFFMTIIVIGIK
jgi:hypothetical protein